MEITLFACCATNGKCILSTTLQEKQSFKAGVEVMYIGSGTSQYMGEVRIPQINSGKSEHWVNGYL